jgi:SAM-dependent methyltransferase
MAEATRPWRLPRTRAVDRIDYLVRLAAGRRVIHIGFAGEARERVDRLRTNPLWLHGRLAEAAATLVGLDVDLEAVERARATGFEAHVADAADRDSLRALLAHGLDPAEVVIAGEVIEHLERPGEFLDAAHDLVAPRGRLVVTTPNAASLLNPVAAAGRYELVNPDHVSFYSWYTLTNLLARHGWRVRDFVTYHFPLAREAWRGSGAAAMGRAMARVQRTLATVWPFLDFGLIAVADEHAGALIGPEERGHAGP